MDKRLSWSLRGCLKSEISKILDLLDEHNIRNIIVDTRYYAFRENANLQHWINQEFMPIIMDSGVVKYAIIVNQMIITGNNESLFEGDEMAVEYFTDASAAQAWISA